MNPELLERRAWMVTAGVSAVAVIVGFAVLVPGWSLVAHNAVPISLLVLICLMATAAPPRVSWMSVVMAADTLPILVAGVLFGAGAAFVVAAVGTIIPRQIVQRKWRALLFSRAGLGLSGAIAAVVYHAIYAAHLPSLSLLDGAAFAAMISTYATINHGTTAMYVAAGRGSRLPSELRAALRQEVSTVIGAFVLGPVVLATYVAFGKAGLVFLVPPVLGVNWFLSRYQAYTKAFLSAVETMATALGAKDQLTLEHSQRVGEYASQIARQMHLSETQVGVMYYNGLLHDIGKLGVCDELLKKPSLFTPSEYEQVKVHAALGEQFTKPFWRVDRAIRRMNYVSYHHERWDGRGYPRGLAGEEIPLGGRILAVADAFDAMTSDRPYHKGIKKEQAFTELIRCAGAQFDPIVVKAFLESQGVSVPPSYERRVRAQELMAHRRTAMRPTVVPSSPTES